MCCVRWGVNSQLCPVPSLQDTDFYISNFDLMCNFKSLIPMQHSHVIYGERYSEQMLLWPIKHTFKNLLASYCERTKRQQSLLGYFDWLQWIMFELTNKCVFLTLCVLFYGPKLCFRKINCISVFFLCYFLFSIFELHQTIIYKLVNWLYCSVFLKTDQS